MKKFATYISVLLTFWLTACSTRTDVRKPPVSAEEALDLAKSYIESQHIDVRKHHIAAVVLRSVPDWHWMVSWELDSHYAPVEYENGKVVAIPLGGGIGVCIRMNRKMHVVYGD